MPFNAFCGISDETGHRELEPAKIQEIQEAIADKLMKERIQEAQEREQKKLEALSVSSKQYQGLKAAKSAERKMVKTQRVKGFHSRDPSELVSAGIPNLPSDNMVEVMRNQFQNIYVEQKRLKDERLKQEQIERKKRYAEVKTTKADELRGDVQRSMSKNLDAATEEFYRKKPKSYSKQQRGGSMLPSISKRTSEVTSVDREKELSRSQV